MFLSDILVLYIVKEFSDYNCFQINIHLDSRLNIQELYCYGPCGCPLEDAIHYLLECPLYTNAKMTLFMNISPYTVISIENLLFGSDNLTDENN
jgi:hypothetical protein